ncbi:hypothetical protein BDF20DRAFT_822474, partial [Mycotypha africana]|uniref:uncharacterized protein n=1 Tax=Mycotypha africana TaxID=64632 RepID=UPI00230004EA
FCDFCQCAFPDNPTNRKNHMEGTAHVNNRKLHYDWFKHPQVFLQEQIDKPPCKYYQQRGHCEFGLLCRFSHITYDAYDGHIIYSPELIQWKNMSDKERRRRQRYKLPTGWKVKDLPPSLKPPPSKKGYDWENVGAWS